MASQVDFSRLRRQNLFPETPDITQGGIMGNVDLSGTDQDFGADQYYGEGPATSVPQSSFQFGDYNFPGTSFGDNPFSDPRQSVNPNIAPPIGGPGSRGATDAEELLKIINGLYTPETTSRDRFNRLLDAAPEREGPGVLRGISAGLMGLGAKDPTEALNIQERVMFAPHNRAMADWTAKTQPFGNAAQYENTSNVNERNLATSVGTNIVNQRRYDQQNEINQQKADSERIRAQAYAFKQTHPDWEIKTDGPRVMAYAPDGTGRSVDLGDSGKMSQIDLENLRGKYRVEVSAQQGSNAAMAAGIRGVTYWRDEAGNLFMQNPTGAGPRMGFEPVTGNAYPKGNLTPIDPTPSSGRTAATNPRAERNDRFQKFADERPDLADKWLIKPVSATGNWGIKPPPAPSGGFMGWGKSVDATAMAEYNLVREELGLPPIPTNQPTQPVQQQPVARPGVGPSAKPAPYVPPTTGYDPFSQGSQTPGQTIGPMPSEDPFAQPEIMPGQKLGTPGEVLGGIRGSLRPQPASQQAILASEIAKGTRLNVTDPKTGQVLGSIPNTPQSIDAATRKGLRVDVR